MSELKPCPFCGGEARAVLMPISGEWRLSCQKCLAVGAPALTESSAIAAWNRRAPDRDEAMTMLRQMREAAARERDEARAEAERLKARVKRLQTAALDFRPGTEAPSTPKGSCRSFIVTVRRHRAPDRLFTFPACYLNEYPLEWNEGEGCGECPDDESHADGCPTTMWTMDRFHPDYESYYEPLLSAGDELVEWAAMPDRSAAHLCEDCPPEGYPTDKTRCSACPRRPRRPHPHR